MADLPYERSDPAAFAWTDKAFDLLDSGVLRGEVHRKGRLEVAVVAGPCPRCMHHFSFETSRDAVATRGGGTLARDDTVVGPEEYIPVDVICRCTAGHDGRLDGEQGCGIRFRIEVLPEAHDG